MRSSLRSPHRRSRSSSLPVFAAFAVVLALGGSSPARGDLATDLSYVSETYLFYVDGSEVVRAHCERGTVLFDRANCAEDPHRVPTGKIFARVEAEIGEKQPALDRRLREHLVRINQIDQRLIMLLSIDPAPAHPELKEAIAKKEAERVSHDAKVQAFKDQVARIEAELLHGEDPDLLDQLAVARAGQREGERAVGIIDEQIADLRRQYITANASIIDPVTYDDLIDRRAGLIEEMTYTRRSLDRVLMLLVETARLERQILDQTFTTERLYDNSSTDQQPPVYSLTKQFDLLDLEIRTVTAKLSSDRRTLVLQSSLPTGIERFTCRITADADCDKMVLKSSDGFSATFGGWSFEVRASDGYVYPNTLNPLLQAKANARWMVTVSECDADVPANAPLINDTFYCYLIAKP